MNVDDVKAMHDEMEQARHRYNNATAALHDAVAKAMAEGARAVDIAEACGVTRGRVYQWADKAETDS